VYSVSFSGTGTISKRFCWVTPASPDSFVTTLWRELLTKEVLSLFGLNDRQLEVIRYLKSHRSVNNREYQHLTGVPGQTSLPDLRGLVSKGHVERVGTTGRNTHYRLLDKPVMLNIETECSWCSKPIINPTSISWNRAGFDPEGPNVLGFMNGT
jgi:hypothetical protein